MKNKDKRNLYQLRAWTLKGGTHKDKKNDKKLRRLYDRQFEKDYDDESTEYGTDTDP